jgi:2-polyprenyl-3-methyl-5-hydroxy-6-metoxy-1,4-benzoquinol methylase
MPEVKDVKEFWEENPLWTGESEHPTGSLEFFEEHNLVYIDDCLGGQFDERVLPPDRNRARVLDLGCGIGFWTEQLGKRGCQRITAADLTENALNLARQRCQIFDIEADFSQENAESLSFPDESFTHVNCQGVIHHTPNTGACVAEIARVLEQQGSASISVYYKNLVLRLWPAIGFLGRVLAKLGFKLKGRGRETIYAESNVNEIVRLYDGIDNPIGKAYSKTEFISMLSPYFDVEETFLHFFPSRSLPFGLPNVLRRILDRHMGFMIYASVTKKSLDGAR